MLPRGAIPILMAAAIVAGLSACTGNGPSSASTPVGLHGTDARWVYSTPSAGVEYGATWSTDGSRLILSWASDGCGPRLEPISVVTPTKLSIGIASTDRSCTAVEKPFVAEAPVPDGVDQSKPVHLELPDGSTVVAPLAR
jgi:hypothetical protein